MILSLFLQAITASAVVTVGHIHSLTGPLAVSEIPVLQAEMMALREINAAGGVLGQQVQSQVCDGETSPPVFAVCAQAMVDNSSIVNVFGSWSSSSRKAVKPIFEAKTNKAGRFLNYWYPVQYEGQECSNRIFYAGAAPNQQIEPAVRWLLRTYPEKDWYLVGSDYVFPRTSNEIIKAMLNYFNKKWLGENYVFLNQSNDNLIPGYVADIKAKLPNGGVIFNTLNGGSNQVFFDELEKQGMTAANYPSMSTSIGEQEIVPAPGGLNIAKVPVGHFATWNYFMLTVNQTIKTDTDQLSANFAKKYVDYLASLGSPNPAAKVNDPMEAAYINVYNWAAAVENAQSFDADLSRSAAYNLLFDAPEGTVQLQSNHHLSKFVRLGRVNSDALFDIAFETTIPVFPQPWNSYLESSRGRVCDHSISADEYYYAPSANIILLYSSAFPTVYDAQMLAINEINQKYGGINNNLLVPFIINVEWDATYMTSMLKSAIVTNKTQAIFSTSLTATSYNAFYKSFLAATAGLDKSDLPLIYLPPSYAPDVLPENVIYLGISAQQFLIPAFNYVSKKNYAGIFYISESDSPFSNQVINVQEKLRSSIIPTIPVVGTSSFSADGSSGSLASLKSFIGQLPAASRYRLFIVSTLSASNPALSELFSYAATLSTSSIKILIVTSGIEEGKLTQNMAGHISVQNYFSSYSSPENDVFLSLLTALNGDIPVTEAMQKSYEAISTLYFNAASKAKSFNPRSVRVNGWEQYTSSAGSIKLEKNNRISSVMRVAQVIAVVNSIKYRIAVGTNSLYREMTYQVDGLLQGQVGYHGPITFIPTATDALRIIVLILAIALIFTFFGSGVYLLMHKKVFNHERMLVVQTVLFGCMLNCGYVFLTIPMNLNRVLCTAQFWTNHIGFAIVFATLLNRSYIILQSTRKDYDASSTSSFKKNIIRYAIFGIIFLVVLIIRSVLTAENPVELYSESIIFGVSIQETYICSADNWEYAILGIEALTLIVGVGLGFQIRDVKTEGDEAFAISSCIYMWVFFKLLSEGLMRLVPYNYLAYFGVRAFSELIIAYHAAHLYVWPCVKIIRGDAPNLGNNNNIAKKEAGKA